MVPAIVKRTGLWRRVDARGVTKDIVAVNADTRGSSTAAQPRAALEAFLRKWIRTREVSWIGTDSHSPGGPAMLGAARRSPPIDLPLLLAGLLLLLADVVFSRLFSHATVRSDSSDRPDSTQATQADNATEAIREAAA